MENRIDFLSQVLASIPDQIAVIDISGKIVYVNKSWIEFGESNSVKIKDWIGVDYLTICDNADATGDVLGGEAVKGIREVIEGLKQDFHLEYPCHSPNEQRWFMMNITGFLLGDERYFVVMHKNITQRKLVENTVNQLARLDGLTGVANRRAFDEFLQAEWQRSARLQVPITLVLIDIDYFKPLNDLQGHLVGDDCLIQLAQLLDRYAKRPGDLCARYGGDEFALVWGNTDSHEAEYMADQLIEKTRQLTVIDAKSNPTGKISVSIGLVSMIPERVEYNQIIIRYADEMLYQAKAQGRDRIEAIRK